MLWNIELPDGRPFATLVLYGEGEAYQYGSEPEAISAYTLGERELGALEQGFSYLGRLLSDSILSPAVVAVATNSGLGEAYADSEILAQGDFRGRTAFGAALVSGTQNAAETSDAAALIVIGRPIKSPRVGAMAATFERLGVTGIRGG